jgi:thiosulfate reductase cytochrome b subunit
MISENQGTMHEALFVDYITPLSIISLYKAMRARHFLVAMVVLATLAVQFVAILSTGLFSVDYLQVSKNTVLQQSDSITGVDHDFGTISSAPAMTIYSVQNTNLSYPDGSDGNYAVPILSSSGKL